MDMESSISCVHTVRIDGAWVVAEIMKKDRQLIEATGLDITPNQGIL